MTVNLNQPLLDHCPFCDYALEGLPEKHVCPECGQPFDRRWVVFGDKSGWRAMKMGERIKMIFGWGVLLLAFLPGVGVFRWPRDVLLWRGVVLCVWGVVLYFIGRGVLGCIRKPRRFVAVGVEGTVLGDRERRGQQMYPWHLIRSVDVESPGGRLLLDVDGKRLLWSLGYGGAAEARRCEEYINKHFELLE